MWKIFKSVLVLFIMFFLILYAVGSGSDSQKLLDKLWAWSNGVNKK